MSTLEVLYSIAAALLVGPPIKQFLILRAHKEGNDFDLKVLFMLHGTGSFAALAFHILQWDIPCAASFIVVGGVSTFTYFVKPLLTKTP